jgi:hypothetical protein
MKKDECKKDSNFCTHFIGDIFNAYHINKCYKYCSYREAKNLMKNYEPGKRVYSMLKHNIRK